MFQRLVSVRRSSVAILLGGLILGVAATVATQSQAEPWTETFDGAPSSPQAWAPDDWDIQYHTRNASYWAAPEGMAQQHGGDCSGPPNTHPASTWPGTVYLCNNHIMTAINATDYGLIYLTPNRLADWSSGPAVIQWDVSTEARSQRDWIDLWITPYDQNLALPLTWFPDLQGPPDDAVHIETANNNHAPVLEIWRDGSDYFPFPTWSIPSIRDGVQAGTNEAATRQTFRLTLSSTSAKFERLASATAPAITFWEDTFPALGYTSGVVQFGHHSYTPWKDGGGGPQTWHWDNVSINPSVPFTMVKADTRYVTNETQTVTFDAPASANSHLRFAANGTVEVSYDGGPWEVATRQHANIPNDGTQASFFHPIPAGTETVNFRFSPRDWFSGDYIAKDFSIWSLDGAPEPTSTNTPSPTETPTTVPTSTPETTATSTPVPTLTPEPTATPTPEPTSTPISPTATPTATPTDTWECQVRVRERLNGGNWTAKWVNADLAMCGR